MGHLRWVGQWRWTNSNRARLPLFVVGITGKGFEILNVSSPVFIDFKFFNQSSKFIHCFIGITNLLSNILLILQRFLSSPAYWSIQNCFSSRNDKSRLMWVTNHSSVSPKDLEYQSKISNHLKLSLRNVSQSRMYSYFKFECNWRLFVMSINPFFNSKWTAFGFWCSSTINIRCSIEKCDHHLKIPIFQTI